MVPQLSPFTRTSDVTIPRQLTPTVGLEPTTTRLTEKNLRTSNTVFHGVVPGKSAYPVGKIELEVAFGDEYDSRAEKLTFEVVKIRSPYYALFGRLAYAKFMARPCYVYLQLKMPGYKGTITMHGSRKVALECEERQRGLR